MTATPFENELLSGVPESRLMISEKPGDRELHRPTPQPRHSGRHRMRPTKQTTEQKYIIVMLSCSSIGYLKV